MTDHDHLDLLAATPDCAVAEEAPETDAPTPAPSREEGGTATMTKPAPPRTNALPPWRVLLHNDDVNEITWVTRSIVQLTPLDSKEAFERTLEAHRRGLSLLVTTHREHAELLQEQFASKDLTVTIEPA